VIISTFYSVVLEEGESFGQTKDRTTLFDDSVVEISLEALLRRLQHLPSSVFDPLMDGAYESN
jgi:TBC domain-containing protein kinase-like protein